jgi:hypothetical protein
MGLFRWLAGAGIDPRWFRATSARSGARGKIFGHEAKTKFGELREPGGIAHSSPVAGIREDGPATTLKPVVETGERLGDNGPGHPGEGDRAGDGEASTWGAHKAGRGVMLPALDGVPRRKPGGSIPNEQTRPVSAPGFLLSTIVHHAASTLA